jgi:hypothetical protein
MSSGCDDMNDAVSETTQSAEQPPRFQFALWQLLAGSILVGAGVVYSPVWTLVIVLMGTFTVMMLYGPQRWRDYAILSTMVIPLFMIVLGTLTTTRRKGPVRMRREAMMMNAIEAALARYHIEYSAYPPDNLPNASGAESLAHFLCDPLQKGGIQNDPFMEPGDIKRDTDGNGTPELKTVWGHDYIYVLRSDGKALAIDRGPDGFLGGTVTHEKGFVPDGSDANSDGVADDKDNLYSSPVVLTKGGL